MRAAPRIALPERVESLPISLSVSTVMLTEVAVRMTPMKRFCKKFSPPRLKNQESRNPPASGTSTPHSAMTKEARPDRLSSAMSVSSPAVNIRTMTPISAHWSRKAVSCRTPSMAGPSTSPASRAPTTCGMAIRLVRMPSSLVLSRMIATLNKKL